LTGDGLQNAEIDGSAAGPVPFAMNEVLSRGKRTVVRVVLLQAGCAAIVASVFLVFKGAHQALAALVGGLIVAAGSAVLGWRVFKPGVAGGATLTTAMYAGVLLKWLWFALALYLAIARLKLDAVPLLIGIVVAQLGYWVGLIRLR
jgi:F0F1-type ATP synthase assembly protein I